MIKYVKFKNFQHRFYKSILVWEILEITPVSPVLLSCGIGLSGIGFPKNLHSGSHPSLTSQIKRRSGSTVFWIIFVAKHVSYSKQKPWHARCALSSPFQLHHRTKYFRYFSVVSLLRIHQTPALYIQHWLAKSKISSRGRTLAKFGSYSVFRQFSSWPSNSAQ